MRRYTGVKDMNGRRIYENDIVFVDEDYETKNIPEETDSDGTKYDAFTITDHNRYYIVPVWKIEPFFAGFGSHNVCHTVATFSNSSKPQEEYTTWYGDVSWDDTKNWRVVGNMKDNASILGIV